MAALERVLDHIINGDGETGIRSCIAAMTTAAWADAQPFKKSGPPEEIKLRGGYKAEARSREFPGHGQYLVLTG